MENGWLAYYEILCITAYFGYSFDILTFDFLHKPPQSATGMGLFYVLNGYRDIFGNMSAEGLFGLDMFKAIK